jgi:hypothetical protein
MFPGNTIEDIAYSGFPNTILSGKSCFGNAFCRIALSDFRYLSFSHLRSCNFCPSLLASFCYHILNIILIGSQKKMVRTNASRIVTMVTDKKVIWNSPICKFIGQPMGKDRAPFSVSLSRNFPISHGGEPSGPCPAMIRFLNFAPKSIFQGNFSMSYTTVKTAKSTISTQNIRAKGYKGLTAVLTDTFNSARQCAIMRMHSDLQSACHASGGCSHAGALFVK